MNDAQKIHAASVELTASIVTVRAAIAALDERREEVSFDALATDNVEAKKALERIHKERAGRQLELEDLESALAASKRKIAEAQQAASAEAERERATKAQPILEMLASRGAKLDAALKSYVENFNGLNADIEELARLGIPVPTRNLVSVNLRNAHDAGMNLDKISRPIQPVRRRTFDELVRGWCVPATRWIAGRLNNAAKDAA